MRGRSLLALVPGIAIGAVGVIAAQILRAAHRPDLPTLDNQDPSGRFGDPSLPLLKVAAMGDSSVTAPGVLLDNSWSRRVARHLSREYHVDLHSLAVGGSKVTDVIDAQLESAISYQPDLVLLAVGANDALRGTPISRFESEANRLLDLLLPHTKAVLFAGVGDLGTIPRLSEPLQTVARRRGRSIDRAIYRVCRRYDRVVKADAWEHPSWAMFEQRPEVAFAADQFHASDEGHNAFAQSAIRAIEEILHEL